MADVMQKRLDNLTELQQQLIVDALGKDRDFNVKELYNSQKGISATCDIIRGVLETTDNLSQTQTQNLSQLLSEGKGEVIKEYFTAFGTGSGTVFDSSLGKASANLLNEFVRKEFNMDFSGNYANEVAEHEYQRFLKHTGSVLGDILTPEKKLALKNTLQNLYAPETDDRTKKNSQKDLQNLLNGLRGEWKTKNGKGQLNESSSYLFLNSICNAYGAAELKDSIDQRFFIYQRQKRNEMKKHVSNSQTFDSSPILFRGLNLPSDVAIEVANDILRNGETGRKENLYANVLDMYTTSDETGKSDFRAVTNENYLSYTVDSNVARTYSTNQSTNGVRNSVIFVNVPQPNDEFINIIDHNDLKKLHEVLRINTEPEEYFGYFINDQGGKYRFVLNNDFHGKDVGDIYKTITGNDYNPELTYTPAEVSKFSEGIQASKDFFENKVILEKINQYKTMATELLKPENDKVLDELLDQTYFRSVFGANKEVAKEIFKTKLEEVTLLSEAEIKKMASDLNNSYLGRSTAGTINSPSELPFKKLFREVNVNGVSKSAFVYASTFDALKEKQPELAQKILNEMPKTQQQAPQPLVQETIQSTAQLTPRESAKQQKKLEKQQRESAKQQAQITKQQNSLEKDLAKEDKKLANLKAKEDKKLAKLRAKQNKKLANLKVKHDKEIEKKGTNLKSLTSYEKEKISIYKDDFVRDANQKRDALIREYEVKMRKELAATIGWSKRGAKKKEMKNGIKAIENKCKTELRTNLAEGLKNLTNELRGNRGQNAQVNTNTPNTQQQAQQQGQSISNVGRKNANDLNNEINKQLETTPAARGRGNN